LGVASGHLVPRRFWEYINRAELFPGGWLHDVGLPLTEAFSTTVTKNGVMRVVIMQAFERTVLTYDPANPAEWQIERANIGAQYLATRQGGGPGPVPTYPDWKGEYFANAELTGQPVLIRNDGAIEFNWGLGRPSTTVPLDAFSIRWTRDLRVAAKATYHVAGRVDDGVRVWIGDRLIVDEWRDTPRVDSYILLDEGTHAVRVEYRELGGEARIRLDLDVIDDYPDWRGAYYNNANLSGEPAFVRDDRSIDFDWDAAGPGSGLRRDDFSIRWTRSVQFDSAIYRFTVTADDGVRLYVEGRLVIDEWDTTGDSTVYTADLSLRSGKRDVRLEYRDRGDEAAVKVNYDRLGLLHRTRGVDWWAYRRFATRPPRQGPAHYLTLRLSSSIEPSRLRHDSAR
jgi:hypothetical protein